MQYYIEPELKIYRQNGVIDLSDYVQTISVRKSLRDPVGTFNISLDPTLGKSTNITISAGRMINEILSQVGLNDIIAGKIDRRSKRHSFLGLVSNPYESFSQMNEQTSRMGIINGGFAMPKLLIKDSIVNAPALATTPEIQNDPVLGRSTEFFAWTRFLKSFQEGEIKPLDKPENFVKWILGKTVNMNLKVLNGRNVVSLFPPPNNNEIDYQGKPFWDFNFLNGETILGERLSTFAGTILNYLYECLDREFYEMFFDTTTGEDGMPYNNMTIRTKPFSHKELEGKNYFTGWNYWEDLDTVTVPRSDQMKVEIGKSDYELKNFFRVNYKKVLLAEALGIFGLNYPILNINSIKKYGLRALEVDSTLMVDIKPFISFHNQKIGEGSPEHFSLITIGKKSALSQIGGNMNLQDGDGLLLGLLGKRNKIKEWYGFPFYESGSMTTPYNEEITIGKRIDLPEYSYYFPQDGKYYKGMKVYAQEVIHTYQRGAFADTKVVVTNGQPDGVVKKYFDHPDNQYIVTPLENQPSKIPVPNYDKTFWDSIRNAQTKALTFTELN